MLTALAELSPVNESRTQIDEKFIHHCFHCLHSCHDLPPTLGRCCQCKETVVQGVFKTSQMITSERCVTL